jgi:hypothetical protein
MRIALACCALLLTSACVAVTTQEPVWKDLPATAEGQATAAEGRRLLIGDTARVLTREGKRHVFRVFQIDPDGFHGTARDNKNYRIAYASLTSLEVQRGETRHEWVPVWVPGPFVGPVGPAGQPAYRGGATGPGLLYMLMLAGIVRHRARADAPD